MEQEIREALEGATPGPWKKVEKVTDGYMEYDCGGYVGPNNEIICHFGDSELYYPSNGESPSGYDSKLIANAPTYLEWCLSQIAELHVKLEKSEAEKLAFWQMVKERGKEIEKRGKERLDYQEWVTAGMRLDRQRHDQEIAELRKENERMKNTLDGPRINI